MINSQTMMILAQTSQCTDDYQFWLGIIQTIAVIVSLFFVSIQIRDGTKSVKSQTYQAIISAYAEIEARISQDEEIARIYYQGCENLFSLKAQEEKEIFMQIICSQFNFFENLHYQYQNGLLEESLWAGWCKSMINMLKKPGINEFWRNKHELYNKDFRICVLKCLESGKCPKN